MRPIATIGYQGTTVPHFLEALRDEGVELLVDVRAVASSRRPRGWRRAPSWRSRGAGIEYLHLRGLGTPADGRAAARAGRHDEMQAIYREQLATAEAQAELHALADLVRSGRRVCLLCFEADPAHCHRSLVASALGELVPVKVVDLAPHAEED